MDGWLITLISLIGSAIVSAVVTTIVKSAVTKQLKKANADQELLAETKRKQRKEDIRECVKEEVTPLKEKLNDLNDHMERIGGGTLSTLRNEILTCYYKCLEKHYRNDYDFTNIHDLYDAYKALGGNSFVADIMERFDNLPTKEIYQATQKQKIKRSYTKKKIILNEDIQK